MVRAASVSGARASSRRGGATAGPCGDGRVGAGEQCDDGNRRDVDGCTNACTFGAVVLGGNATTHVAAAFTMIGQAVTRGEGTLAAPVGGGVIVTSLDGGTGALTEYDTFLRAGGHVLVIGGSNSEPFYAWIRRYLNQTGRTDAPGWQQIMCAPHYARAEAHPITRLLPETHSFAMSNVSYHMVRFAASQPEGVTILANTCLSGDRGSIAVRRYPDGGTFTYVAYDIGQYGDATTEREFVAPLLRGYLDFVRSPP